MKKCIIFDFNGTLLNDVELGLELINYFLHKQGKRELNMDEYRHVFSFPIKDYYVKAGLDLEVDRFEDLAIVYNKMYMEKAINCKLYDGVIETLKILKNMGIFLICLSSSEINNLKIQLTQYDILKYFNAILGTSNVEGGSKKEIGYSYITRSNINPQDILVIGDSLHDVEVANMIGADACLFTKGHQHEDSFVGYKTIDSFKEILDIIK